MRVRDLKKKSAPRIDSNYLQNLNIQSYGEDNLYPQVFRNIVQASASGNECVDRLTDFVEGNGFKDEAFSAYVVNRREDTMDDIHASICRDIAMFGGLALHVNYNALGEIVELHHVPFENCRLEEPDSVGYVAHIAVHPDWTGKKKRAGSPIQVKKENVDYINVFNPRKEVVLAQIASVGGIEYYKGQILWLSMSGKYEYPIGKGDKVATEMSTDEGLANVKFRNARYSFLPAMAVITKEGVATTDSGVGGDTVRFDNDPLHDALTKIQGDTAAGKIVEITIGSDEEKPEIMKLESNNYDKAFTTTEESVTERIYSAFGQEPWYCIRKGKIGFSGDILGDAFEYYNSIVNRQQRFIERAITMIFKNWYEVANPSGDYSIRPLIYVKNDNNGE